MEEGSRNNAEVHSAAFTSVGYFNIVLAIPSRLCSPLSSGSRLVQGPHSGPTYKGADRQML